MVLYYSASPKSLEEFDSQQIKDIYYHKLKCDGVIRMEKGYLFCDVQEKLDLINEVKDSNRTYFELCRNKESETKETALVKIKNRYGGEIETFASWKGRKPAVFYIQLPIIFGSPIIVGTADRDEAIDLARAHKFSLTMDSKTWLFVHIDSGMKVEKIIDIVTKAIFYYLAAGYIFCERKENKRKQEEAIRKWNQEQAEEREKRLLKKNDNVALSVFTGFLASIVACALTWSIEPTLGLIVGGITFIIVGIKMHSRFTNEE